MGRVFVFGLPTGGHACFADEMTFVRETNAVKCFLCGVEVANGVVFIAPETSKHCCAECFPDDEMIERANEIARDIP